MSKLIDCFTFYNELEILELRLKETYDVVDKFILVEADRTFKGDNKKFIFEENKGMFSEWLDKIIHIKINFPNFEDSNPWNYEKYQRNSFLTPLFYLNLLDSDKVIISDVDEIPDASTIAYIKNYPLNGIFKLEMDQYFGSFRNKMSNPAKWYHPKIMNWGHLKTQTPDNCRSNFNCQWWERGGWHLSYFGGPDKIIQKIESFSHQEYNNSKIKDPERIKEKISSNEDFLDDWRTFVNIDPKSNPYLPKNWDLLEKFDKDNFSELYKKQLFKEFKPQGDLAQVKTNNTISAWGNIPSIIPSIIKKFNIRCNRALEFGVEFGYSTSAISNFFNSVIGVDTFEGDINSTFKQNHFEKTKDLLKEFQNIELIKSDYRDFINTNDEKYDLIHVDIVHDYENTYKCGEWSIKHSKITLFHDTITFPEVMRACEDLSLKYDLEFYNYPDDNGLGILYNKSLEPKKKFTIGWISHNEKDFEKYLGPSIKRLSKGEFEFNTITTSDESKSSCNYNKMIEECQTRWLILCHEDVSFSWDFLECLDKTIRYNPEYTFFGFVGASESGTSKSSKDELFLMETCDSCLIVIDLEKNKCKFDESIFDDFHLHVEDFCMQSGGLGKTILIQYLEENQFVEINDIESRKSWIYHQSTSCKSDGSWWGEYKKYVDRLNTKWGKEVPRT